LNKKLITSGIAISVVGVAVLLAVIWGQPRTFVSNTLRGLDPAKTAYVSVGGATSGQCVKSASMFNASYSGMNFGRGARFPVQAIFDNPEGKWVQINERIFSAMYLNSNGNTYAVEVDCK
jgi:hypothetical protein